MEDRLTDQQIRDWVAGLPDVEARLATKGGLASATAAAGSVYSRLSVDRDPANAIAVALTHKEYLEKEWSMYEVAWDRLEELFDDTERVEVALNLFAVAYLIAKKLAAIDELCRHYFLMDRLPTKSPRTLHEGRVYLIGSHLLNRDESAPDYVDRGDFYKDLKSVVGVGKSAIIYSLKKTGCFVKGKRGSSGDKLPEQIDAIVTFARQVNREGV